MKNIRKVDSKIPLSPSRKLSHTEIDKEWTFVLYSGSPDLDIWIGRTESKTKREQEQKANSQSESRLGEKRDNRKYSLISFLRLISTWNWELKQVSPAQPNPSFFFFLAWEKGTSLTEASLAWPTLLVPSLMHGDFASTSHLSWQNLAAHPTSFIGTASIPLERVTLASNLRKGSDPAINHFFSFP